MRLSLLIAFFTFVLLSGNTALGQGRTTAPQQGLNIVDKTDQLGVGLQAGSLSGVNVQYWTTADRTVNAALTAERGNIALTASHSWYFRDTFRGDFRNFVPFAGAGLIGAWGDRSDYFSRPDDENFAMGLQVPLGIEFLPSMQRFSVFAELAPSLEFVPKSFTFLTGDVGARYYF